MRRLQDWREAPLDTLLLTLYQLQGYYIDVCRMGRANKGEYHLQLEEFPLLAVSEESLTLEKTLPRKTRSLTCAKNYRVPSVSRLLTCLMQPAQPRIRSQSVQESEGSIQFNASMKCSLIRGMADVVIESSSCTQAQLFASTYCMVAANTF